MDRFSTDHHGPLVALGLVQFCAPSDLPGVGHVDFSAPAFLAYEESSRFEMDWNGVALQRKGGWNDYYGFGTSPDNLISDKAAQFARLAGGPDIQIITTIQAKLCIPSKDTPFYNHSQRIQSVPSKWGRPEIEEPKPRDFIVWRNGKVTKAAQEFLSEIARLVALDAAPARKGPIFSVLSRKVPVSDQGIIWPLAQASARRNIDEVPHA